MSSLIDPTKKLSQDPMFLTLSFLDEKDLRRCCQLNRQWKTLASDNRFWNPIWEDFTANHSIPKEMSTKQYFDSHAKESFDHLFYTMRKFFKTVQVDQTANFRCSFSPMGQRENCCLDVSISFRRTLDSNVQKLEKTCFFVGSLAREPLALRRELWGDTLPQCQQGSPEAYPEVYEDTQWPIAYRQEDKNCGHFVSQVAVGIVLPVKTAFRNEVTKIVNDRVSELAKDLEGAQQPGCFKKALIHLGIISQR